MGSKGRLPKDASSDCSLRQKKLEDAANYRNLMMQSTSMDDIENLSGRIAEVLVKLKYLSLAQRNLVFVSLSKKHGEVDGYRRAELAASVSTFIMQAKPKNTRGKTPTEEMVFEYADADDQARASTELAKMINQYRSRLISALESIPSSKVKIIAGLRANAEIDGNVPYWVMCLENHWIMNNALVQPLAREMIEEFDGHITPIHWLYVDRFSEYLSGRTREQYFSEAREWYCAEFTSAFESVKDMPNINFEMAYPSEGPWSLIAVVRDLRLRSAVFRPARQYFKALLKWQSPEGYWTSGYGPQVQPNVMSTAAIAVGLGTFFGLSDDTVRKSVYSACDWLAAAQRKDGGWVHLGSNKSDCLVTALILDALRRTDPDHYHRQIVNAEQFLLNKQRPDGLWDLRGRASETLNAIVAESVLDLAPRFSKEAGFADLAKEHFFIASEGTDSDEIVGRQMSIIGLHMASEFFCYALHQALDPPEPYFNDQGKTVGLREALAALERRKVLAGEIPEGGSLPYRTQLRELANLRDEVVHKVKFPDKSDVKRHRDNVRKFMNEMISGFLL